MDQFGFFFAFFGLILGLALAELLNSFAAILREKVRPAWGVVTPLLGLLIVIEIAATFVDAWLKLRSVNINLVGFALPGLIGITYYVAAVMAVPRTATDWASLDDYFYARRYWIVGLLIVANLGHMALELPAVLSEGRLVAHIVGNAFLFGPYIALLLSRWRWLSVTAIGLILFYFIMAYGFTGG